MKKNSLALLLPSLLLFLTFISVSAFGEETATTLLPANAGSVILSSLGAGASAVAVENQSLKEAVRIHIAEKAKNYWDVQFIFKSSAAVSAGTSVRFSMSVRCLGSEGKLLATVKDKSGAPLFREEIKPESTWKKIELSGTAKADTPKGELSLVVAMGYQAQDLEIAEVAFFIGGGSPPVAPLNATDKTSVSKESDKKSK
jgi:hypothetical protein